MYSPITIKALKLRRIKGTDNVTHTEERKSVYRVWVGKSERKRLFRRTRQRWDNNILLILNKWNINCAFLGY